jgi:hypothetical protein
MLQRARAVDLPKHRPEWSLQPANRAAPGPDMRLGRRSSGRQAEPPCPHLPFVVRPGQRDDAQRSDGFRSGSAATLAGAVSISAAALSVVISAASARQFSGCRSGQQLRCHPLSIHWVEHDLYRDSNLSRRLWQA